MMTTFVTIRHPARFASHTYTSHGSTGLRLTLPGLLANYGGTRLHQTQPFLLASRGIASFGGTRLRQTAVPYYAGGHAPSTANSLSAENKRHPETDITVNESATALHKDKGERKRWPNQESLAGIVGGGISHVQEASCPTSEKEPAKNPTPPGHLGNEHWLPGEDQKRTHDNSDERDATVDQASKKPDRSSHDKRKALLAKRKRWIKRCIRDRGAFASQDAIEYQKKLDNAKRHRHEDEMAYRQGHQAACLARMSVAGGQGRVVRGGADTVYRPNHTHYESAQRRDERPR